MKTKLSVLPALLLATLLSMGMFSIPVFAHTDNLSTITTCQAPAGCAVGTSVVDSIYLCISTSGNTSHCPGGQNTSNPCVDTSSGTQLGTLCIKVYHANVDVTCAALGTALSPGPSPSTINIPVTNNEVTATYTSTLATAGFAAGSYVWIVQYVPPGWTGSGPSGSRTGHDLAPMQTCELFKLFPAPPPTGAPEFPFGSVLLMALAIPALLLIRSKFSKTVGPQVP